MDENRRVATINGAECKLCEHHLCSFLPDRHKACSHSFRQLLRGDRLSVDDGSCLRFWVVLSGTAALCTTLADGRRQIVELETPGDFTCGLSAIDGAQGWIEALCDCMICEVDLSQVAGILRNDPQFALDMFRRVHNRLEKSAAHIVALGRLDSMERICFFLSEMARRTGRLNGRQARVNLPMTREDIADYLGLNSETVSRILGRIKKAGLTVFISPTDYVVPDLEALERRFPITPTYANKEAV
ncbi:Crp/Fnr family transcriptional regulator [Oricola sp.]|uniref:Crp/Fnr family transcriptional regulator n=1 Tax=Oricola sp. TaxID=1979950 RepID=UPI003BAD70B8